MTADCRWLVVNADDFGLSHGVNRGIIVAYERGIVTSASLMVRPAGATAAAAYGRAHPELSVGLHLDLGEWAYRDGRWVQAYAVVPIADAGAVAAEVARQLDTFRRLMGHEPTHLDSHQHVHREEPARSVVLAVGRELAIPVRHLSPDVRYCGNFYGQSGKGDPYPQGIAVETLLAILSALPPGITELACHPGFADDLDSVYRDERAAEVVVLCNPGVRLAINASGLHLRSFGDIAAHPLPLRSPTR